MKIAFVTGEFPLVSETFVVNAAKAVLDAGHDLTVLALDPDPDRSRLVQGAVARYGMDDFVHRPKVPKGWKKGPAAVSALGQASRRHGLTALRLPADLPPEGPRTAVQNFFDASALPRRARFDVIHCHFATFGPRIINLRRLGLLRGRVLVHFRGYDITSFVREHGEDTYRHVFRAADHFVANCEHFRQRAIALGAPKERIDILPSGLDVDHFPFNPPILHPGEPLRLVSVGRLVGKKGFGDVIEALPAIRRAGVDVRYTIIGEGTLRGDFEKRAAALGVSDIVELRGAQPLEEVGRTLGRSHLFLGPSVTADNGDQDASTNVLKEAMATGLPVIGTYHGGIPELVEDGAVGYLVPERSPSSIADAVLRLHGEADRWIDMGRRGRARVLDGYSLETTAKTMLGIYARMIEGERA